MEGWEDAGGRSRNGSSMKAVSEFVLLGMMVVAVYVAAKGAGLIVQEGSRMGTGGVQLSLWVLAIIIPTAALLVYLGWAVRFVWRS